MKVLSDNELRLRPIQLPEDLTAALPWYRDKEVLYYSEGEGTLPYDLKTIERMYHYLLEIGELYIIEFNQGYEWIPIGDAALSKRMIPIVIGSKDYRGRGIGTRVISLLIKRAKELGGTKSGSIKYIITISPREKCLKVWDLLKRKPNGMKREGNTIVLFLI